MIRNNYIEFKKGSSFKKFVEEIISKDVYKNTPLVDIAHSNNVLNSIRQKILSNIKRGGGNVIIGDYDGDGVTGSTILAKAIRFSGGTVDVILPDRHKDGYGISKNLVDKAILMGYGKGDLIITVDNGINNISACLYAQEKGFEVIVTDHHLPNNDDYKQIEYTFNPHINETGLVNEDICGATVAYLLALALLEEFDAPMAFVNELKELAAIGTVTDVMPVANENLSLLKDTLSKWRKSIVYNKGLKSLIQALGKFSKDELDIENVGFYIGPCINAAGRLRSADLSFDILNDNSYVDAYKNSLDLVDINQKRKDIVNSIAGSILDDCMEDNNNVIVRRILSSDYPEYTINELEGVAGLIASKICNSLNKPTLFFVDEKFSGRSTLDVNLHKLITISKDDKLGFGGHAGACGGKFLCDVSGEDFERLEKNMSDNISKATYDVTVNKIIVPNDANIEDINQVLYDLAPLPTGFPTLVFKDITLTKGFCSDSISTFKIQGTELEVLDFNNIIDTTSKEVHLDELEFKLMSSKGKVSITVQR